MLPNNSILLNEDPTLPDLFPEDTLFNEFRLNDFSMPLMHPDIAELTRKLEHLTLESNTQGLRLEVEKAKRQRLQASMRQIKSNLALSCPEIVALRTELQCLRDRQNEINYCLDNENVKTNTLSFRCLSRVCQILATMIPRASLPTDPSPEVQILLGELTNIIQHFGVHYAASHV